ncbi:MAG: hypothetical protein HY744_20080 [Deltaproteobacteria bacterium]|nr:hypothetical protein [Deltaproteobacteria bacterium]
MPEAPFVAGAPASLWTEPDDRGLWVHALAVDGASPALEVATALVSAAGIEWRGVRPLGQPAAARLVEGWPGAGLLLADMDGGEVVLRAVSAAGPSDPVAVPVPGPASAVVQAVSLSGDAGLAAARVLVAVLLAGPSRLLVVDLALPLAVRGWATLDLSGEAAQDAVLFSRRLVAVAQDRLLLAAGAGIEAVRARRVRGRLRVARDETFAGAGLRGPVVPVVVAGAPTGPGTFP